MATLFLLNPDFNDPRISADEKYYCPHCARIEGVLHYYPRLREAIDIEYVNFQRPRQKIINLIGEENQGCPVLVIDASELEDKELDLSSFTKRGSYLFANATGVIANYLAQKYTIGHPHP